MIEADVEFFFLPDTVALIDLCRRKQVERIGYGRFACFGIWRLIKIQEEHAHSNEVNFPDPDWQQCLKT